MAFIPGNQAENMFAGNPGSVNRDDASSRGWKMGSYMKVKDFVGLCGMLGIVGGLGQQIIMKITWLVATHMFFDFHPDPWGR